MTSAHRIAQKCAFIICLLLLCIFPPGWAKKWPSINPASPIHITMETPTWHTPTYVSIPVQIRIDKNWKLYGPSGSGDTLIRPPQFLWTHANIQALEVIWPNAAVYKENAQQFHAYKDTVKAEIRIRLKDPIPTSIPLNFNGLTCSTICRPLSQLTVLSLVPPVDVSLQPSLLNMLWYAFLGGLILNIMPCVFPVLGLKLGSFASMSSTLLRKACGYTALGIFCSFWGFALLILLLQKVLHREVGWGMQFQNPYFASCMSLVMLFLAHSFWGVFSFNTPKWAQNLVPKTGGTAWYSFLSGVLAVFLATPCSAPFLGAAVGFALTGSSLEILGTFTCIALGFALPYIVSLFIPLGRVLPKPGPWMRYVSICMGILFLTTACWLVWKVLGPFLSAPLQDASWIFLGVLVGLPFVYRYIRTSKYLNSGALCMVLMGVATLAFLGLPFLENLMGDPNLRSLPKVSMIDGKIRWIPWSEKTLQEALQTGRVVFIDVTASACLNCEVNKRRVILSDPIQALLVSSDIVCLRADFTTGSSTILAFLKKYGRAGVPFNMVLSQSYPQGIVLSEFLSVKEIQDAVDLIRKKALTTLKTSSYDGKRLGILPGEPRDILN